MDRDRYLIEHGYLITVVQAEGRIQYARPLGPTRPRLPFEHVFGLNVFSLAPPDDSLTGLPNRSLLQTRMQQAMSAARRSGGPMALMIMDLDHFKEVNDTLGHAVGDELLVEVARRLRSAVRSADTVARLGGDEFAVVLPGADVRVAQPTAARILSAVQQPLAILPQGIDIDVRGSIGMALYPQHGLKPDELLRRADVEVDCDGVDVGEFVREALDRTLNPDLWTCLTARPEPVSVVSVPVVRGCQRPARLTAVRRQKSRSVWG